MAQGLAGDEVDIVFAPNGGGKSAVYSMLVSREDELFDEASRWCRARIYTSTVKSQIIQAADNLMLYYKQGLQLADIGLVEASSALICGAEFRHSWDVRFGLPASLPHESILGHGHL